MEKRGVKIKKRGINMVRRIVGLGEGESGLISNIVISLLEGSY